MVGWFVPTISTVLEGFPYVASHRRCNRSSYLVDDRCHRHSPAHVPRVASLRDSYAATGVYTAYEDRPPVSEHFLHASCRRNGASSQLCAMGPRCIRVRTDPSLSARTLPHLESVSGLVSLDVPRLPDSTFGDWGASSSSEKKANRVIDSTKTDPRQSLVL